MILWKIFKTVLIDIPETILCIINKLKATQDNEIGQNNIKKNFLDIN